MKTSINFFCGILAAFLLTTILSIIDGKHNHSILFFLLSLWCISIIIYLAFQPRKFIDKINWKLPESADDKVKRLFREPFVKQCELKNEYEKRQRLYINRHVPGRSSESDRGR